MTQLLPVLICGYEGRKIYMFLNVCSSDFGIFILFHTFSDILKFESYLELQVISSFILYKKEKQNHTFRLCHVRLLFYVLGFWDPYLIFIQYFEV